MLVSDILKSFKIKHWVKNLVVFVPIIFSLRFTDLNSIAESILACLAFCFCASAVYVMNDMVDIKKDRLHPIKKFRAIASGRISKFMAATMLTVTLIFALILASFANKATMFLVLGYFILNIFYSIKLKHIAIVDVFCIALGFILRILAGCCAISVYPSPLVILMTFFVSLFFSFIKRKLELQISGKDARQSLEGLTQELINAYILIFATLSIAFYFTYMLDNKIMNYGGNLTYVTTIPFCLIILRILLLASAGSNDDPIHVFEDKTLIYLIVFYLIVLFSVLAICC